MRKSLKRMCRSLASLVHGRGTASRLGLKVKTIRMLKKVQITVTAFILIDENNGVVKDYESTEELVDDVVSFKFNPSLPVMSGGGVRVDEIIAEDFEVLQ